MTTPEPVPEFQTLVDREFLRGTPVTSAIRKFAGSFGELGGCGRMVLEHEVMVDPGEAVCDVGGLYLRSRGTPLPLVHKHCDRTDEGVKAAVEEAAAAVERATLGLDGPRSLTSHGLLTVPGRMEIQPHGGDVQRNVGRMVNRARSEDFYGPFILVCSRRLYGEKVEALVPRLMDPGKDEDPVIVAVVPSRHLDDHPGNPLLLVQATPEVCRVIDGMTPRLTERDGKTCAMTITVTQLRSDYYGNAGVVVCPLGK